MIFFPILFCCAKHQQRYLGLVPPLDKKAHVLTAGIGSDILNTNHTFPSPPYHVHESPLPSALELFSRVLSDFPYFVYRISPIKKNCSNSRSRSIGFFLYCLYEISYSLSNGAARYTENPIFL